MKIRSNLAKL